MKVLSAVLKFSLEIVLAAMSGGAKSNDTYGTKNSDMVLDKNGDLKYKSDRVEYY